MARDIARDKHSMCCMWFARHCTLATWAYVLETVYSSMRRLKKSRIAPLNVIIIIFVIILFMTCAFALLCQSSACVPTFCTGGARSNKCPTYACLLQEFSNCNSTLLITVRHLSFTIITVFYLLPLGILLCNQNSTPLVIVCYLGLTFVEVLHR